MEKVNYAGWENCYRIANNQIELIITADVGPRIIRFNFLDRENMFKEYPEQMGVTKSDEWLIFGGHRLWHAPEVITRTYYPDLEPVLVQETDGGLIATQKPEATTGLQKQIIINLSKDKAEVQLTHRLINHNLWPVETAPWAISVMAPGGVAILPLPPRKPHPQFILPTATLSIWPYTDLSDERWMFGERFIMLKQDPEADKPQKMGIFTPDGWAAYANQNCLFIKQIAIQFDSEYPDLGSNFEVFTNEAMLELESLAPIDSIPPKGYIDHQEHWTLIKDIPTPLTEQDVIKNILPPIIA